MKNIFLLLLLMISCESFPQSSCSQYTTVPLRTFNVPENECYYLKDTNNELQDYEGTWNNKTVFITLKKIINKYDNILKYNTDYLMGRYKTVDINGNILFDNTNLSFEDSKIFGSGFQKITDKYLMGYFDKDICRMNGYIEITFANTAKTQLNFSFHAEEVFIDTDCYFYNLPQTERPEPLPVSIILTKQ